MDFRRLNYSYSILLSVFALFSIGFILFASNLDEVMKNFPKFPIDYEMKGLNECYLTVHNFISLNSTSVLSDQNDSTMLNNQTFRTYIYSYTRPFMLELVQNSTESCLCCN